MFLPLVEQPCIVRHPLRIIHLLYFNTHLYNICLFFLRVPALFFNHACSLKWSVNRSSNLRFSVLIRFGWQMNPYCVLFSSASISCDWWIGGLCKGSVVLRSPSHSIVMESNKQFNRKYFFMDLRSFPSLSSLSVHFRWSSTLPLQLSPDPDSISPESQMRSRSDSCRVFDFLSFLLWPSWIGVGLVYMGWSTSGPAYFLISSVSHSNVASYANVCHSLYRLDPTKKYHRDQGIVFSIIHKANGAPQISTRYCLSTLVSCKNMILPGPAVTVGTQATARVI